MSVTRDELRLALLREALICRDPITVELTPTVRAVVNEFRKRGTAEVTLGGEACTVALKEQRTDVQRDAVRAARQVLVWLEQGETFTEDAVVDRLVEVFSPDAAQRGVGWLRARGLIDTSQGRVTDETGDEFRPARRDPDTIGELVSVLEPEPEPAPKPRITPAAPKAAAAGPKPLLLPTVLTDGMSPAEMSRRFRQHYARTDEETTMITNAMTWVLKSIVGTGGVVIVGSETWDRMNTAVYGVLWDFVRMMVATGHLVRFEHGGRTAFRTA